MKLVTGNIPSAPRFQGSLWVSFDGVECAGKTTLCDRLQAVLPDAQVMPEFSASPVGEYLRESVQSSPHFISRSFVGQSLLFLADYAELAATRTATDEIVLQDRGFLSKFVYQFLVLQEGMGTQRARNLVSAIVDELPQPDVTVLLDAPFEVIEARLRVARPGWISPERQEFVEQAAEVFRAEPQRLGGAYLHVTQDSSDTVDDLVAVVLDQLKPMLPG